MTRRLPAKAVLTVCILFSLVFLLAGCVYNFHIHRHTETVIPPSCDQAGYTEFVCHCGDRYREQEVAALGHCYTTTVVDPTYITDGYTQYLCQTCGETHKDNFTKIPPEVVYTDAIKDYLLPFEKFTRARTQNPEFVMIHFSSAVVLSPDDPYNMDIIRQIFVDYEVSTHYIIDRDGTIYCYIPENLVAYHAGYGTWGNDPKYTDLLNDYAIGIELVAMGSQKDMAQYLTPSEYQRLDPRLIGYTAEQYIALKGLVRDICNRSKIPMDRQHIIGHQEYSPNKPDPGELFDWDRLLSQ